MFYIPEEPPVFAPERDEKTDDAKAALMRDLFGPQPDRVVYGRQVEVLFEDRFFHWITARGLRELAQEGSIGSETRPLGAPDGPTIRFFFSKKNRYARHPCGQPGSDR